MKLTLAAVAAAVLAACTFDAVRAVTNIDDSSVQFIDEAGTVQGTVRQSAAGEVTVDVRGRAAGRESRAARAAPRARRRCARGLDRVRVRTADRQARGHLRARDRCAHSRAQSDVRLGLPSARPPVPQATTVRVPSKLGIGNVAPAYAVHAVSNANGGYVMMAETTTTGQEARLGVRGPGVQDQIELNAWPGYAAIQSGKSAMRPLRVMSSNMYHDTSYKLGLGTLTPSEMLHVAGNIRADGTVSASGEVYAYGYPLAHTHNFRSIVTKNNADGYCTSAYAGSTAINVPFSWRGKTGNQICAGDGRGKTTCAAVPYLYITIENVHGRYAPNDGSCSAGVDRPWPWGNENGGPNTLSGEWVTAMHVVCCR
jgi:hypothetical protein